LTTFILSTQTKKYVSCTYQTADSNKALFVCTYTSCMDYICFAVMKQTWQNKGSIFWDTGSLPCLKTSGINCPVTKSNTPEQILVLHHSENFKTCITELCRLRLSWLWRRRKHVPPKPWPTYTVYNSEERSLNLHGHKNLKFQEGIIKAKTRTSGKICMHKHKRKSIPNQGYNR
jgi:hypothetical protein